MCKWNHKVSFTHSRHEWCNLTNFYLAFFLLMSLLENATSPWGQSWERVLHKHSCIHHSTCAFGTRAVICMHLCLCKTHSRDCPHGEIRHSLIAALIKSPWWKMLSFLCLYKIKTCQIAVCNNLLWWNEIIVYHFTIVDLLSNCSM